MPTAALRSDVLAFPVTPPPPKQPKRGITNDKSLQGLRPPTDKAVEDYVDTLTPGLYLRITNKDFRSWSFRYTNPQGRSRRIDLGTLRELTLANARRIINGYREADGTVVKGYRDLLREGQDPAEQRAERRKATTFGALFAEWTAKHARGLKRKASIEVTRIQRVLKSWMHRVADDVTMQDVLEVFDVETAEGRLVTANHLRKDISRIYNWGKRRGLVTTNPATGIKLNKIKGRKRVMSAAELNRLWHAATESQTPHLAVWFKLRLVTGQRGGELLLMRWQDIDPQTHWWLIPGDFTKNGEQHAVYLSTLARELLATLPQCAKDGPYDKTWVFPAGDSVITKGKRKGQLQHGPNGVAVMSERGFVGATSNVMGSYDKIGFRLAQPNRADIRDLDFRGHDLRRAMTTFCTTAQVPRSLMRKILNHVDEETEDVTARYDRKDYSPEKRAIMDFWAKMLRLIIAGENFEEAGWFSMAAPQPPQPTVATTSLSAIQVLLAATTLTPEARLAAIDALVKAGSA